MLLLEQGRAPDQAVGAPQPNSSQDTALQSSQRWSSGKSGCDLVWISNKPGRGPTPTSPDSLEAPHLFSLKQRLCGVWKRSLSCVWHC